MILVAAGKKRACYQAPRDTPDCAGGRVGRIVDSVEAGAALRLQFLGRGDIGEDHELLHDQLVAVEVSEAPRLPQSLPSLPEAGNPGDPFDRNLMKSRYSFECSKGA